MQTFEAHNSDYLVPAWVAKFFFHEKESLCQYYVSSFIANFGKFVTYKLKIYLDIKKDKSC